MKRWKWDDTTKMVIKAFVAGGMISVLVLLNYQTHFAAKKEYGGKLGEIIDVMDEYYLHEYDKEAFTDYMYEMGMTYFKDPYTAYFPKQEYKEFQQAVNGTYSGIGIEYKDQEIMTVFPNTPAEKAGLQAGDIILKVNGKTAETDEDIAAFIKEAEDNKYTIIVLRDGAEISFELKRETIVIPVVETEPEDDAVVSDELLYIRLNSFNHRSYTELVDALKNDKDKQGVIIDLRDNAGGYLDVVQSILEHFCGEDKIIYYEKTKKETVPFYGKGKPVDVPMVILVNEYTASAAEVFAAAMRENNGAIIVGNPTYGKGVIQRTFTFDDGSGIKVTIAEWLTPSKECIHKKGIAPDYTVSDFQEQLKKAEEILLKK